VLPHPVGNETILVVEDNAELLEIVVTMIRDLGYKVLVAANGIEEIALLNGDTPIDLLFSDVVIPNGINGADLASEARSIDKNLKVLLTSGYPGTHGAEAASDDFPILAKPTAATIWPACCERRQLHRDTHACRLRASAPIPCRAHIHSHDDSDCHAVDAMPVLRIEGARATRRTRCSACRQYGDRL
jgi:CheY-like chemotaxis protein